MDIEPDKEYTASLMQTMYQLSQKPFLVDFVVKIKGRKWKCHKAIIFSTSKQFVQLCESNTLEKVLDEIIAPDKQADIVDSLIKFLYLGNCNIARDNVGSLLRLAKRIKLSELETKCEQYLADNLSKKELVRFMSSRLTMKPSGISDAASSISSTQAASSPTPASPSSTSASSSSTPATPASPAAPSSTPASPLSTEISLPPKSSTPPDEFFKQLKLSAPTPRPSDVREEILILGGLLPGEAHHRDIVFLEKDAGVADVPAAPMLATVKPTSLSACCNEDFLVVSGGYDRTTKRSVATVQIFDIRRKRWSNLPDLTHPVDYHGSAIANGNMYSLGGCYEENGQTKIRHDSIHRIELPAGKWTECDARLPSAVAAPGIATVEDDIVIVGGETDSGLTAQTSRFNTKSNRLTPCQSTPIADNPSCSTVAVQNRIYVLSHQQFVCYDVPNDSWSSLAMPMKPSYAPAMVLKKHRLIAMGGHDGDRKSPNDRVQVYDLNTGKWEAQKNMPLKLTMHWAVVMKVSP